jgi:hypothetical protein
MRALLRLLALALALSAAQVAGAEEEHFAEPVDDGSGGAAESGTAADTVGSQGEAALETALPPDEAVMQSPSVGAGAEAAATEAAAAPRAAEESEAEAAAAAGGSVSAPATEPGAPQTAAPDDAPADGAAASSSSDSSTSSADDGESAATAELTVLTREVADGTVDAPQEATKRVSAIMQRAEARGVGGDALAALRVQGAGLVAATFDRERMVDNQLRRDLLALVVRC